MRKVFTFFAVFAALAALFAAPALAAEDDKVKGLWIEIPKLPEAESTVFTAQSGGEGEAYYERVFDGGALVVSVERVDAENRNGDAWTPGDAAKLTVRLENIRKEIEVPEDEIDVTESVEELAEIYTYPVATTRYMTGKEEDVRGNQDIFIFTDEWIFRVHMSMAGDKVEDYDADDLKSWFENMKIAERGASASDESGKGEGEEGRGDVFDEESEDDDKASSGEEIGFVAVVYMASGYRGLSWQIPAPGDYDLRKPNGFDFPNDSVCSVAVCPGYKVTLFEHSEFGGKSAEFTESADDLGEYNRWASSLKVEEAEEPDPGVAFEWYMVQAENGAAVSYQELDLEDEQTAMAIAEYSEIIPQIKGLGEREWYGETTDDERIELGGSLLTMFRHMRVDTGDWEDSSFAQAMNNFYDWRKGENVWDVACLILGVDPAIFEQ